MTGNNRTEKFLLQPRDRQLLKEAATLKVFDRKQAELCAGFKSASRANIRLPKLVRAGLLKRFFVATENGGKKSLYTLTSKGAVVAEVSFSGLKRSKDKLLVGDLFVAHQLRINDIYLEIKYKQIPVAGVKFKQWLVPRAPLSSSAPVIPDAFFQIEHASRTINTFVEVDLGGESSTVWTEKIDAYLTFATTGQFKQIFSEPQFRVVVVTSSERRVQFLSKLAARQTDKIFWFSTFELINLNGFWAAVWFRPGSDQPKCFCEVL